MIKTSNFRSRALARLKWSRSSRTDKGVGSLHTVVSARLEVDPSAWDEDVEGRSIAEAVNARLPDSVRVFGAYSCPKSFQARRAAVNRTYEYLVPARVFGFEPDEDSSFRDAPSVDSSSARSPWLGVKSAEARKGAGGPRVSRRTQSVRGRALLPQLHEARDLRPERNDGGGRTRGKSIDASEVDPDRGGEEERLSAPAGGCVSLRDVSPSATSSSAGPAYVGSKSSGYYWPWPRRVGFGRDQTPPRGHRLRRVGPNERPRPGAPGPARRRSFARRLGDSFVLYQIRKMIAVALAVALGHVPPEVVPLTLHRPARFATPAAPAATLFLADAEFAPFTTAGETSREERRSEEGSRGRRRRFGRRRRTRLGPERRTGWRRSRPGRRRAPRSGGSGSRRSSRRWRRRWRRRVGTVRGKPLQARLWARGEEGVRRIDALDEMMAKFEPYEEEMRAKREESERAEWRKRGRGRGGEGGEDEQERGGAER